MKKIEILPLPTETKKRLSTFAGQYRRMGRLFIEIVSFDGSRLIVRAEQKERVGEKILSKSEIEQRVRAMFEGEIPPEWKLTVSAVNYDRADIDAVDAEWVRATMERLGLRAKHIESHTGISKSTLSILLNGHRPLTRWHKIAFYYLFKHIEFGGFDQTK